jgi:type 1 glutamine amidotransferase
VTRTLILSGAGRYADPWHPFPQTSARVRDVLDGLGHQTQVSEDVETRLADLSGVDLLVVNVGCPDDPASAGLAAARDGLLAFMQRGGRLLSLHVSATSFPTMPEWEGVVGGRWVRGQTMHPPIGPAQIRIRPEKHPVTAGLSDFELTDERYSYLRTSADISVLADHDHDGRRHPLVWTRETGTSRVVYDALGHDTRSYDSPERCRLLANEASWLVTD